MPTRECSPGGGSGSKSDLSKLLTKAKGSSVVAELRANYVLFVGQSLQSSTGYAPSGLIATAFSFGGTYAFHMQAS